MTPTVDVTVNSGVGSRSADQSIGACSTFKRVIASAAIKCVGARITSQYIVKLGTRDILDTGQRIAIASRSRWTG